MALSLEALYGSVRLTYDIHLLAGRAGIRKPVHWVHVVEGQDISDALRSNDLAITAGIGQIGSAWLPEFVNQLCRRGASGLVIHSGPYIRSVPPEVVAFCENAGFPLFTAPWKTRPADIAYELCRRIVRSEEAEAGLAAAFQNAIFFSSNPETYQTALERQGYQSGACFCVAVLSPAPEGCPAETQALEELKLGAQHFFERSGRKCDSFLQESTVVTIFQDYPEEEVRTCCAALSRDLGTAPLFAGVSPIGPGFSSLGEGYKKAAAALRLARRQSLPFLSYSNMGVYRLFTAVEDKAVLSELYTESLGRLADFDAENGTDYLDTLRCYLENDSSVQEVARITHVHRNTVNYKIRKIRNILRMDLSYAQKLDLMLAFYIRDYL